MGLLYGRPVQNCSDVSISLRWTGGWNEKAPAFRLDFRGKFASAHDAMTENLAVFCDRKRPESRSIGSSRADGAKFVPVCCTREVFDCSIIAPLKMGSQTT